MDFQGNITNNCKLSTRKGGSKFVIKYASASDEEEPTDQYDHSHLAL
jgi:hypothetical protein